VVICDLAFTFKIRRPCRKYIWKENIEKSFPTNLSI